MIRFFKNDFNKVRAAMQFVFPQLPMVVIVGWYLVALPLGLLAAIPLRIWYWVLLRNLAKEEA